MGLSHNKEKKSMKFFLLAARHLLKCAAVCWVCLTLSFIDRSKHQDDVVLVLRDHKFGSLR